MRGYSLSLFAPLCLSFFWLSMRLSRQDFSAAAPRIDRIYHSELRGEELIVILECPEESLLRQTFLQNPNFIANPFMMYLLFPFLGTEFFSPV